MYAALCTGCTTLAMLTQQPTTLSVQSHIEAQAASYIAQSDKRRWLLECPLTCLWQPRSQSWLAE